MERLICFINFWINLSTLEKKLETSGMIKNIVVGLVIAGLVFFGYTEHAKVAQKDSEIQKLNTEIATINQKVSDAEKLAQETSEQNSFLQARIQELEVKIVEMKKPRKKPAKTSKKKKTNQKVKKSNK